MWLLIHAGIKIKPGLLKSPQIAQDLSTFCKKIKTNEKPRSEATH